MIARTCVNKVGAFSAIYKNYPNTQLSFQHYHDSCEICFFISADLEIFIKDARYDINDGDVIFINEYDIHHFLYSNVSTIYPRYVINFTKEYIHPQLKSAGIEYILDNLSESKYAHAATTLKERKELEALFQSITQVYQASDDEAAPNLKEATMKAYLQLILSRLWELIRDFKPESTQSKKYEHILKIIHYIDNNYMHQIRLDMLEEMFFIDKYHISHIFKEVTSFSIMEYVQQRRIIEAQKMLNNSQKQLTDICFDCGFNNIQHFYRVFKKISGITPDKYRRNKLL